MFVRGYFGGLLLSTSSLSSRSTSVRTQHWAGYTTSVPRPAREHRGQNERQTAGNASGHHCQQQQSVVLPHPTLVTHHHRRRQGKSEREQCRAAERKLASNDQARRRSTHDAGEHRE